MSEITFKKGDLVLINSAWYNVKVLNEKKARQLRLSKESCKKFNVVILGYTTEVEKAEKKAEK